MGDKLLLLLFLFFSTTNGQFTTTSSTNIQSESKEPLNKVKDGHSPELTIHYSVGSPGDEKSKKINPDNDIGSSEDDAEELLLIESLIGDDGGKLAFTETITNAHGDDTGVKYFPDNIEDPIVASNTDDVAVRRQENVNSEFSRSSTPESHFGDPNVATPLYEPASDQLFRRNPSVDSSPLLQLTQGGYQRPYERTNQYAEQQQKLVSESATQQSERVETPNSKSNSGERREKVRSGSRVPTSMLQPHFGLRPGPVFRNPFGYEINNFGSSNGIIPSNIHNPFLNTPAADFNQGYFSQVNNNGDFPGNVRDSPLFQAPPRTVAPNPGYLFQAPLQYPGTQPVPMNSGQIPALFQPGVSPGYSNYDNSGDSHGADFTAMFGNVAPMNPQFQDNSNIYGATPNFGGNIFSNPGLGLMSNYPNSNDGSQFPPRFMNFPLPTVRISPQNLNRQQSSNSSPSNENSRQIEQINASTNKEHPTAVPFGTRIQRQNNGQPRNEFERQDDMYIRYPMTEAGYATQDILPIQNDTDKTERVNNSPPRQPFPFFSVPRRYNVFNGPDPYKVALENIQGEYQNGRNRNIEIKNGTEESHPEQSLRDVPLLPNQPHPDVPTQIFRTYPERNPDLSIPNPPFYQVQGVNTDRNPFDQLSIFPGNNYQFPSRSSGEELNKTPDCAKKNNVSLCFEDSEYPRGDLLYVLNSDSFLIDRLVMPDQQLDGIDFVDQNTTESPQSEDNYICKSVIKYGLPLRAQNIKGNWKIIVNMERAIGKGKFVQPVRLEICKRAGNPCNFTEIKTTCVQKYSFQRLLSWSAEKGVHNDVYKLPVACSCQIIETTV